MKEPHITALKVGDVLRIAMRGGRQLVPNHKREMRSLPKSRRARSYDRTVILGRVVSNTPTTGTLVIDFGGVDRVNNTEHFLGTIRYSDIEVIQLYINNAFPIIEHSDPQHPGGKALGTKYAGLFQFGNYDLVNVRF